MKDGSDEHIPHLLHNFHVFRSFPALSSSFFFRQALHIDSILVASAFHSALLVRISLAHLVGLAASRWLENALAPSLWSFPTPDVSSFCHGQAPSCKCWKICIQYGIKASVERNKMMQLWTRFVRRQGSIPIVLRGNHTKRIPCCSCSDWSGRAKDGQLQAHCLGLDVPLRGRRYLFVPPCVYLQQSYQPSLLPVSLPLVSDSPVTVARLGALSL